MVAKAVTLTKRHEEHSLDGTIRHTIPYGNDTEDFCCSIKSEEKIIRGI